MLFRSQLASSSPQTVGDVQFSRMMANYDPKVVPTQWQFTGSAKYAGRDVTVGPASTDGVNVTIGGDMKTGLQLRVVDRLAKVTPPPEFPAPPSIKVAGLQIDLSKLNLLKTTVETASKSYTYKSPDFRV